MFYFKDLKENEIHEGWFGDKGNGGDTWGGNPLLFNSLVTKPALRLDLK
jgi:hypothetical protein